MTRAVCLRVNPTDHSVLRHSRIPAIDDIAFPRGEDLDVAVLATIFCGGMTCYIERVVTEAPPGERVALYSVRLDGVRGPGHVGVAEIELDDSDDDLRAKLDALATVSVVASDLILEFQNGAEPGWGGPL